MVYSAPSVILSAVIYYALLLRADRGLPDEGPGAEGRAEGAWLGGGLRHTKGRDTGREGSQRLLLLLRRLFYSLGSKAARKTGCKRWGRRHRA